MLVQKMHEEEQKLEQLSWFKKNIVFISQVRTFRETVQAWVTELCREEGKKDYDRMAHLISDYEQVEDKGIIGWASCLRHGLLLPGGIQGGSAQVFRLP